ncbi:MAG: hypothetical protein IMF01_03970 [Proteobacteria bacterium]|nr:hypothetical protein [Pseudomonadota bacterium]
MKEEEEIRLNLRDTPFDVIQKMSGGNPDAMEVCMAIMRDGSKIDPDSALGGVGVLLSLDTNHIYKSRIWLLYKAVCGEDLIKMLAVLRACQLGFLDVDNLDHAIDNYGDGIDVNALEEQVRGRLPKFGKK